MKIAFTSHTTENAQITLAPNGKLNGPVVYSVDNTAFQMQPAGDGLSALCVSSGVDGDTANITISDGVLTDTIIYTCTAAFATDFGTTVSAVPK